MSNFLPTDEQLAVLKAFQTGENLKITAVAGSGKTSTLKLLGESTDKRGLYVAYNKAIQVAAAASFPSTVECRTMHSLAYRTHGAPNRARMALPRLFGYKLANAMNLTQSVKISDEVTLTPAKVAPLVMETIEGFCRSADDEISAKHTPFIEGVEDRNALVSVLVPAAQKAWADLNDPKGKLKVGHSHYLKMWALTKPKLNYDFILFDEAQDANPLMAKVILDQDAQLVAVGDESQAIYGWNGAIDALANWPAIHVCALTQSFRFGHAVADEANVWLEILGAPVRVRGFDKVHSKVEPCAAPDTILCRINATCIAEALSAQESGRKVAIVGGTKEIERFTKAADRLMGGMSVDHEDLVAFGSWPEVMAYTQNEKAGAELRVQVKLITDYGVQAILDICSNSVDEKHADVRVSTAHKAKGLEWGSVRVANDFREPQEGAERVSRTDAMLAYVVVTRAQHTLDLGGLHWGRNWIGK